MPAGTVSLSLILIALGVNAVILSFLVPDKKKSTISLILAIVIVAVGVVQFGTQSVSQFKVRQQMKEIQRRNQVDLDEIRQRLRERAADANDGARQQAPATAPR